jgi:hypothetical protein
VAARDIGGSERETIRCRTRKLEQSHMVIYNTAWRDLARSDLGFLNTLSRMFVSLECRHPHALPNLRAAECLFVASDYGGEHNSAIYYTIAFLLADIAECATWQSTRASIRSNRRLGRRRMAFKNINDSVRARALHEFLDSANMIPGLLIVFAIHKRSGSLFGSGGKMDPTALEYEPLRVLSAPIAEKLMRVISLLGFLIAGFSAPGQDVLWATDEDAIAANAHRVRHLVDALALITSNLLDHDLRHLRVATAKQDKGDLSLEDLLAIPDIAAGSLSDALSNMFLHGAPPAGLEFPRSSAVSPKGRQVLNWFSDNSQPLKRMCVLIDQTPDTHKIRATHIRFHGSNDLL